MDIDISVDANKKFQTYMEKNVDRRTDNLSISFAYLIMIYIIFYEAFYCIVFVMINYYIPNTKKHQRINPGVKDNLATC